MRALPRGEPPTGEPGILQVPFWTTDSPVCAWATTRTQRLSCGTVALMASSLARAQNPIFDTDGQEPSRVRRPRPQRASINTTNPEQRPQAAEAQSSQPAKPDAKVSRVARK